MAKATRETGKRHFYKEALTMAEQAGFGEALAVDGVDEEVVALRLRLRTALKESSEDLALILRGMDVLRRLVVTKYGLSKEDQRAFDSAFAGETLRRVVARGEGEDDDAA